MAESSVQVNSGAGPKLRTWNRTIGGVSVEEEAMFLAEQPLAEYTINSAAVSIATANDHVMQVMAGATLHVYVRRIRVWQAALATTAAITQFQVLRLTTAGTGGTAIAVSALDTADAAAGATAMTLPTVKGTEGTAIMRPTAIVTQTAPVAGGSSLLLDLDFQSLRGKSLRIPAGAANGIVLKIISATAAATVFPQIEVTEANF
jgi:hypothetical protein